jgi:cell division septal protein FtsQ
MRRATLTVPGQFLRRGPGGSVGGGRRRRNLRRRLLALGGLFALGLCGGILYAGRYYLTHSQRFALRRIAFSEVRHAPEADLRHAIGRSIGRNLFALDLDRLAGSLATCHWVKRAVIKRVLPDGLYCAIEEREPRGLALVHGRVWLVDADGETIDAYGERTREYSFPIFTGIDERDAARGRAQIGRGVALLSWLQQSHADLAAEISEIDLSRDDRLELRMNDGGPVVRLNPRDFGANLDRYLTMRGYLETRFGDGAYVDLRFRDRIAFQPALARTD